MKNEFVIVTSEQFSLRPYTPKDLCNMYGVSKKTLLTWLKPFAAEIGNRTGHFYTVAQVEIIVNRLGIPGRAITDGD